MSENRMPARLLALIFSVVLLAVASIVWLVARFPLQLTTMIALLALAEIASELFPVRLPSGATISVSYPLNVAALLLGGPVASVVNATLGSAAQNLRSRKPPMKMAYNLAQTALSTSLAAVAFKGSGSLVGITYPLEQPLGQGHYPEILFPAAVFALVAFILNTALVGAAVSLSTGLSFWHVWVTSSAWQSTTQIPLALLGVALAQALVLEASLGLLLFVVPLVVSRGVFQGYVRLREAYADTVRGLVAAIEAKDPYTKGHSERVSDYAGAIADSMRLPSMRTENLELAAILHDLGKVGVGTGILTKDGRLSPDEWAIVREHPRIAADIIRSVPFLQDALPAIEFHHERYDGTGYLAGLSGEEIPLEARILAVADSYDAMTSRRAYRNALSHEDAAAELLEHSGTQFDPQVVRSFLASESIASYGGSAGETIE